MELVAPCTLFERSFLRALADYQAEGRYLDLDRDVLEGDFGRYIAAPDGTGYLMYVHEGIVFAAPMDLKRLEVTGPASPVLEDVGYRSYVDAYTSDSYSSDTYPSDNFADDRAADNAPAPQVDSGITACRVILVLSVSGPLGFCDRA